MTSIPVSNTTKSVQMVTNQNGAYGTVVSSKSEQTQTSFQETMNLFSEQNMLKEDEVKVTNATENFTQQTSTQAKIENSIQSKKELSEDEVEEVRVMEEKVISEISEKLGVSVEEAMEQLGLTVFDLINPNNMAMLMTDLLNLSDQTILLTDGQLFETLTVLTETVDTMVSTISNELGIPAEELQIQYEMFTQVSVNENEDVITGNESTVEVIQPEQNEADVKMQLIEEESATLQEVPQDEHVETKVVADDSKTAEESVSDDVSIQEKEGVNRDLPKESGNSELSQNSKGDERDTEGGKTFNQAVFTTFSNNMEQVIAGQNVESASVFEMNTVDSILEQIGEYVRINVTPDVTSMEIHLTPANLGNVYINLVSKNGIVTAQITAENEVVKQALETQVVQLKERLEAQGVKIEAVEVTVASHEFERNLDGNNENREQHDEVQKTSRKKWNLSRMEDELEEEQLTEAEKVELDMMKLTGNQLNYMV